MALVAIAALSTTSCAGALPRPTMPGGTSWHWDNVVALPAGVLIRVATIDHARHEGTLISADDAGLSLRTKQGTSSFPASLVRRVERLTAPAGSRARRALAAAAVGTAVVLITEALECQALGGRPCSPRPKSIAVSAAIFGGIGAMSENRRPMTIYVRP